MRTFRVFGREITFGRFDFFQWNFPLQQNVIKCKLKTCATQTKLLHVYASYEGLLDIILDFFHQVAVPSNLDRVVWNMQWHKFGTMTKDFFFPGQKPEFMSMLVFYALNLQLFFPLWFPCQDFMEYQFHWCLTLTCFIWLHNQIKFIRNSKSQFSFAAIAMTAETWIYRVTLVCYPKNGAAPFHSVVNLTRVRW